MALVTPPACLRHGMRESRAKGDHRLALVDKSMQIRQGHLAVMVDQENEVLEGEGNAFAFLDSSIEVAVDAGGELSDMAGVAVDLVLMDLMAGAPGQLAVALLTPDLHGAGLLH